MSSPGFRRLVIGEPPTRNEILRRRLRALEESFQIRNLDSRFPIFSNFTLKSGSGLTYSVEIREGLHWESCVPLGRSDAR